MKATLEVEQIVCQVRSRGDLALVELTARFDGVDISKKGLRVSGEDIKLAYEKVEQSEIQALEFLRRRIESVERRKLRRLNYVHSDSLIRMTQRTRPLNSVGCYVPAGLATYPSTLLMTVVPAKIAGVKRVIVCSPPRRGDVDPLILVAADICAVDEIYRVGGAQAIAAMAYGTESIAPVEKIVGPAGRFVTTAKMLVSKDVAIDIPAGPSEVVILADSNA
ncbi:MAG: histidinol dehydrogenase, partial [Candidatus Bathyarchaeia archaeon]